MRRRMMMKSSIYDKEVEYLESVPGYGTTYIDTDIYGTYNLKIRIVFQLLETSPGSALFGAYSRGKNNYYLYISNNSQKCLQFGFGTLENSQIPSDLLKHEVIFDKGKFYLDGNLILDLSASSSMKTENPLLLFGMAKLDGTYYYTPRMKIFLCEMYLYDELFRNFIPVRKRNMGCMYESVTKALHFNKGTRNFVLGPDK